nr:hypothetical protein [Agromyces laixinhei]
MVGDPENRLEAETEAPDALFVALGAQECVADRSDASFVERYAFVGAVQIPVGKSELDRPGRSRRGERIHGVLQQLADLTVAVSARTEAVFLIDMFFEEVKIDLVRAKSNSLPLFDVVAQPAARAVPFHGSAFRCRARWASIRLRRAREGRPCEL